MRELIASLSSARKKFLDTGLFTKEEFEKIVALDPSPTKKYLEWSCNELSKQPGLSLHFLEGLLEDLYYLEKSNLIPGFDINRFKGGLPGLEEMIKDMMGAKVDRSLGLHRMQKGKDYELVYENNEWFVFKILSYKGSRTLGSKTPWCVVANEGHYESYTTSRGLKVFFFYISKTYPVVKYAILVPVEYKGSTHKVDPYREAEVTDDSNHNTTFNAVEDKTGIPWKALASHLSLPILDKASIDKRLKSYLSAVEVSSLPNGKHLITLNKAQSDNMVSVDGNTLFGIFRDSTFSVGEDLIFIGSMDSIIFRKCHFLGLDSIKDLNVFSVQFFQCSFEGNIQFPGRDYTELLFDGCDFEKSKFFVPHDNVDRIIFQGCSGTGNLDVGGTNVWITKTAYSDTFRGKIRAFGTLNSFDIRSFHLESPFPKMVEIRVGYSSPSEVDVNGSGFSVFTIKSWRDNQESDMQNGLREILHPGSSKIVGEDDPNPCPVVKGFKTVNLNIFIPIVDLSNIQADFKYLACSRVYTSELSKMKPLKPGQVVTMNLRVDGVFFLPEGAPGSNLSLNVVGFIPWLYGSIYDSGKHWSFSTFKGELNLRFVDINWSIMSRDNMTSFRASLQAMKLSGMDPVNTHIGFADVKSSPSLNYWLEQMETELGLEDARPGIVSNLFRGKLCSRQ